MNKQYGMDEEALRAADGGTPQTTEASALPPRSADGGTVKTRTETDGKKRSSRSAAPKRGVVREAQEGAVKETVFDGDMLLSLYGGAKEVETGDADTSKGDAPIQNAAESPANDKIADAPTAETPAKAETPIKAAIAETPDPLPPKEDSEEMPAVSGVVMSASKQAFAAPQPPEDDASGTEEDDDGDEDKNEDEAVSQKPLKKKRGIAREAQTGDEPVKESVFEGDALLSLYGGSGETESDAAPENAAPEGAAETTPKKRKAAPSRRQKETEQAEGDLLALLYEIQAEKDPKQNDVVIEAEEQKDLPSVAEKAPDAKKPSDPETTGSQKADMPAAPEPEAAAATEAETSPTAEAEAVTASAPAAEHSEDLSKAPSPEAAKTSADASEDIVSVKPHKKAAGTPKKESGARPTPKAAPLTSPKKASKPNAPKSGAPKHTEQAAPKREAPRQSSSKQNGAKGDVSRKRAPAPIIKDGKKRLYPLSAGLRAEDWHGPATGPFLKSGDTPFGIMGSVVIALIPAFIWGVYLFGTRALLQILSAVLFCLVFEVAFDAAVTVIRHRPYGEIINGARDLSFAVTGLLIGFLLPAAAPLWAAPLAAFIAIIIGKKAFGGIGKNLLNPALLGIGVLHLFPNLMQNLTQPFAALPLSVTVPEDFASAASPLLQLKNGLLPTQLTTMDAFIGNMTGAIGEVSTLLLLCGAVFLAVRRIASFYAPVAFIGTVAAATYLFPQGDLDTNFMFYSLLSGSLFLCALFCATDYTTTPVRPAGKLIFGAGAGVICVLIRYFTPLAEGAVFAVLIMNLLTPALNRLTRPKPFGGVKSAADEAPAKARTEKKENPADGKVPVRKAAGRNSADGRASGSKTPHKKSPDKAGNTTETPTGTVVFRLTEETAGQKEETPVSDPPKTPRSGKAPETDTSAADTPAEAVTDGTRTFRLPKDTPSSEKTPEKPRRPRQKPATADAAPAEKAPQKKNRVPTPEDAPAARKAPDEATPGRAENKQDRAPKASSRAPKRRITEDGAAEAFSLGSDISGEMTEASEEEDA